MTGILLAIVGAAAVGGGLLYKGLRDDRDAQADRPEYPPWIGRELKDADIRRVREPVTNASVHHLPHVHLDRRPAASEPVHRRLR